VQWNSPPWESDWPGSLVLLVDTHGFCRTLPPPAAPVSAKVGRGGTGQQKGLAAHQYGSGTDLVRDRCRKSRSYRGSWHHYGPIRKAIHDVMRQLRDTSLPIPILPIRFFPLVVIPADNEYHLVVTYVPISANNLLTYD
jgi:hypothetical protein